MAPFVPRCATKKKPLAVSGFFDKFQAISVVVFQSQMRDELLTAQVTQRVLQLHRLNEEVVFGVEAWLGHRRLQVEAEPLLYADAAQLLATLRKIQEQHQV